LELFKLTLGESVADFDSSMEEGSVSRSLFLSVAVLPTAGNPFTLQALCSSRNESFPTAEAFSRSISCGAAQTDNPLAFGNELRTKELGEGIKPVTAVAAINAEESAIDNLLSFMVAPFSSYLKYYYNTLNNSG
jgi:hypothetical protein